MKKFTALILIIVLVFTFVSVHAASGSGEEINVILLGEDFNTLSDETVSSAAVKVENTGGFVEIRPRDESQSDDKALFMGWRNDDDTGVGYIDINIPEIQTGECSFEFDLFLNGNTGDYSRLYVGENAEDSHIFSFKDNKIGNFMSLPEAEWVRVKLELDFDDKNAQGLPLNWYIDDDGNGFVFKKTIRTGYFEKLNFLRLRPYFNFDNEGCFGIDNVRYTVKKPKGVITSVNDGSPVSFDQKELTFQMDNIPENLTKDYISIKSLYTNIAAQDIEINNETKTVSCVFSEDINSATDYILNIDKAAYCSDDVTDNVTMSFTTLAKEIDVKEPACSNGTMTIDVINNSSRAREYNVFVVVYKDGVISELRNSCGIAAAGDSVNPNETISSLPTAPGYSYRVFVSKGWNDKSIFVNKAWTIN